MAVLSETMTLKHGSSPRRHLPVSKPRRLRASVRPLLGPSPARPASIDLLPTHIRPFMNVPVVSTTDFVLKVMPKKVTTPVTSSFALTSRSTAWPSRMSRFGVDSRTLRISRLYSSLSVCSRGKELVKPLRAGGMASQEATAAHLRSESPHSRALGGVENSLLQVAPVGHLADLAAQGVHLMDQLRFCRAAHGRIAGLPGHLVEGHG